MTTTLPEGIITNTDSISADIEQVDAVTVEDVRRLWKVYSVNKHVLRHNSGRRLENLFWRIWGNHGRLCRILSGSTVARLFNYISDDHDIIRTTPVASPRAAQRRIKFSEAPGRRETSSSSSGESQGASDKQSEAKEPARPVPSQSSRNPPPRPPILKKSRGSEDGQREVSAGGDSVQAYSSGPPRPAPSTPPSAKPQDGPKRKKTTFVASSSSARRKPAMVRRKSSQSSGAGASSIKSPTAATISEAPGKDEEEEKNDSDRVRSGKEEGKRESEPSSRRSQQAGPTGSAETEEGRQKNIRAGLFTTFSTPSLVSLGRGERLEDPQRRKLAAISTRPLVTKTSATLASTSTAAVGRVGLGEAPQLMTSSSGKGKQRTIIDEVVPLKPAATTSTTRSGSSSSSAVVSEEGNAHARVLLPRSKSQLSLLLERDRQHSSGGSNAGGQEQQEAGSSGARKNRKASA